MKMKTMKEKEKESNKINHLLFDFNRDSKLIVRHFIQNPIQLIINSIKSAHHSLALKHLIINSI